MGRLTTHVLDTALGKPARGLKILLYRVQANSHHRLGEAFTNGDGRTESPMLDGSTFLFGHYELIFGAGAYLRAQGQPSDFLDEIPIRFIIDEDRHYHVPLLLSPYGYSTYRGS